jgi:ABC-type multidrug transport system permease subunit
MLEDYARLARPYFVLLGIVTAGRWLQGTAFGTAYEQGTHVFSIVTLTLFASLFSAVFLRRWRGWRLGDAAAFAMFMAVVSQLVIWLSTVVSYALNVPSYFSHPMALNRQAEPVAFLPAMGFRAVGLVVNTLLNGIAGALGWALGGLLPQKAP